MLELSRYPVIDEHKRRNICICAVSAAAARADMGMHICATSGHIVRFAAKWIREFADARCVALDRARAP
jgi:hypothetical protein